MTVCDNFVTYLCFQLINDMAKIVKREINELPAKPTFGELTMLGTTVSALLRKRSTTSIETLVNLKPPPYKL